MFGDIQLCILLCLVWIPGLLKAQHPRSAQDIEDLMYRSESVIIPEKVFYEINDVGSTSIDLNGATAAELELSELFTPFQLYKLLKYREKYGEIYSIYELAVLPGFHQSKIREIEPYVSLKHGKTITGRKPAGQMLMIDMGRTFPGSKGYLEGPGGEPPYAGSPLKVCTRFRSHPFNSLSLGLTFEKDAGEPFMYKTRPQFVSGYLSYTGKRFIRHLVLGNFQLNQGVGLVNGSGFIHQVGNFTVNQQSISSIKPYASKTESLFEQGIACQLEQNKITLLIWASCHSLSLSPSALAEKPEVNSWLEYQRTSGLYRTAGELEGRNLAYRMHTGFQVLYKNRDLALGILGCTQRVYPGKKVMEYIASISGPGIYHHASLHFNWQKSSVQLFGELSMNKSASPAALLGTVYHFNDFIHGSLLLHHYGAGYRGSLPSSYASGSSMKNEQGIAFHLHVETGKFLNAELRGELFRYPFPRYLTNVPSGGYRVDLSLRNPGNSVLQWRARIVHKTWQTSPDDNTAKIRPLKDSRQTRLDGQVIYNYKDHFKWQSRVIISHYSQQLTKEPGFAAVQQITLKPSATISATAQFVLFQIADWENRIYLYEPGFYYSFNFPSCYGNGQKATLLFTIKPAKRIAFSAKISAYEYYNRERIGTGNDQLEGNRKWETGLQLRLNL